MTTRGTIEFLLQTRRWDDPEPTPVPGRHVAAIEIYEIRMEYR